jgi:hypothetical protein
MIQKTGGWLISELLHERPFDSLVPRAFPQAALLNPFEQLQRESGVRGVKNN